MGKAKPQGGKAATRGCRWEMRQRGTQVTAPSGVTAPLCFLIVVVVTQPGHHTQKSDFYCRSITF